MRGDPRIRNGHLGSSLETRHRQYRLPGDEKARVFLFSGYSTERRGSSTLCWRVLAEHELGGETQTPHAQSALTAIPGALLPLILLAPAQRNPMRQERTCLIFRR